MLREISAGGVVVRKEEGVWWMAAIELPKEEFPKEELPKEALQDKDSPQLKATAPEPATAAKSGKRSVRPKSKSKTKAVICLPKGLVDSGEKALDAALREVREETGVTASLVAKLADIKYTYVRSWGDRARVFKLVSFYLLRYESGEIDDISEAMRIEVAQAKWVRLEDAPKLLAYRGERDMARKAMEYIAGHREL
jgi:8-oxo-dGTP pyrophosphatase MutT (NUDIX family)